MSEIVTTPEECVAFVERVGLCTWRHQPRLAGLPSLEMATNWRGMDVTLNTWFWKDDLHITRRLFYAPLIAPDVPVFVSLAFLPALIAAQGDIDARTLYEQGRLAFNAWTVYQHVERMGPTATSVLPWPKGSRMLYLASLQQKFLLTKYDLTGRTRGTYGYRWCLAEHAFPDAFTQAARLPVADARKNVCNHLKESGADISETQAARLFRWQPI